MKAELFVNELGKMGVDTVVGVPDSTLKEFCEYINTDGKEKVNHYTTPNEGAAIGLAVGNYLADGRPACVYMQNSGLGNIVNPITSLANKAVYDIPMILVIGWRGEPGKKDEPQHVFMGEVTTKIVEDLDIDYSVIGSETTDDELKAMMEKANEDITNNRQYAFIVKKGTFDKYVTEGRQNGYSLNREYVLGRILKNLSKDDYVVSTTGKISREIYEQSDAILGQHAQHFLTVGGMGHASMIAYGIAAKEENSKVYCIDGDGAVLMHMGALAFIGKQKPSNYVHICINNDSHESVGGMPTGAVGQDYSKVASVCGYEKTYMVTNEEELTYTLNELKSVKGPVMVEIKVALGAREDLGRPKETAVENKNNFMNYHRK